MNKNSDFTALRILLAGAVTYFIYARGSSVLDLCTLEFGTEFGSIIFCIMVFCLAIASLWEDVVVFILRTFPLLALIFILAQ